MNRVLAVLSEIWFSMVEGWTLRDDRSEDLDDTLANPPDEESSELDPSTPRQQVLQQIATKQMSRSRSIPRLPIKNNPPRPTYHRPMDIQANQAPVPENEILPPPRPVRGINGED